MKGRKCALISLLSLLGSWEASFAKDARAWGEFVEPGFPYVASTIDGRSVQGGDQPDNLVVRGVVVFLGNETYACYDTDLVRLALVWKGDFLAYRAMAPHTYYHQGKKNHGGQKWISRVTGRCLTETGLYPGAQSGGLQLTDPRPQGPDPREIGRGPVDSSQARWLGTHVLGEQAVVKYSVGRTVVKERLLSLSDEGGTGYVRHFQTGPHRDPVQIALSARMGKVFRSQSDVEVASLGQAPRTRFVILGESRATLRVDQSGAVVLVLPSSRAAADIRVGVLQDSAVSRSDLESYLRANRRFPRLLHDARRHWRDTVSTRGSLGKGNGFVVDEVTLPEGNPWKRQIRVADTVFLPDKTAAVVTFDGDVWLLSGITPSLDQLRWRRVASGLHEPQSINWRDGKLFVYTRNGLIRLNDLNGDGEIDYYETFSNDFTQTAETREFPNDSVVTRDGGFLLAKPGQQAAHQGRHNGSILRVSPDGKTVRELAHGFRQPYLGYRAADDFITASDQQGHWVPTTPIHWVREGHHFGHRPSSEVLPPSRSPTPPLCWIPHRVVQSATSQVWVESEKMGPLNGRLLCLDYYRANTMLVHFDQQAEPVQAAVSGLNLDVDLPVLKGEVNPHDGWLYLTGFQIWGSHTTPWSGIRRIRYVGDEVDFPTRVRTVREGVILGFEHPLDQDEALRLANYHVGRWNYRRTKNYGSGHYRLDGKPGSEVVGISGVVLSADRKALMMVIPDMQPVMQMEVVYRLRTVEGQALEGSAYATVHELQSVDLAEMGFSVSEVAGALESPVHNQSALEEGGEGGAVSGKVLYETMGCMACHSLDGSTVGRSGPSLKGVFGSLREFQKGAPRRADRPYLRDAILNPPKNILKAYATSDIGMPSYSGILNERQVDALIEFIASLAE